MDSGDIELVLFDTDPTFLEGLKRSWVSLPYISYQTGYGPEVVVKAGLDAMWATPMMGVELFGAAPPFPIHQAQVLKTPAAQLRLGMPRYGVVGVATTASDPKTPEYNLRLVLSALLKAVRRFNSKQSDQIRRVGILPRHLDLQRLDLSEASHIIRELYDSREGT